MRMSVSIDNKLISEAQQLTMKRTKKEVIEEALKELIRRKRREEAIKHAGKVEMDITVKELLDLRKSG